MYKGKTATLAKLWNVPGGTQIAELKADVEVTGDPPSGGYAYIRTPKQGYTRTIWLKDYRLVEGPTPPPPPDPDPEPAPDVLTVDVNIELTADLNGKQYRKTVMLNDVKLDPL